MRRMSHAADSSETQFIAREAFSSTFVRKQWSNQPNKSNNRSENIHSVNNYSHISSRQQLQSHKLNTTTTVTWAQHNNYSHMSSTQQLQSHQLNKTITVTSAQQNNYSHISSTQHRIISGIQTNPRMFNKINKQISLIWPDQTQVDTEPPQSKHF